MKLCSKLCKECPFSKKSLPGYLGPHQPEDFLTFLQTEFPFACHMTIQGSEDVTVEMMLSQAKPVCRGFAIMANKSAKLFGSNPITGQALRQLQQEVSQDDAADSVMSIFEFLQHHRL